MKDNPIVNRWSFAELLGAIFNVILKPLFYFPVIALCFSAIISNRNFSSLLIFALSIVGAFLWNSKFMLTHDLSVYRRMYTGFLTKFDQCRLYRLDASCILNFSKEEDDITLPLSHRLSLRIIRECKIFYVERVGNNNYPSSHTSYPFLCVPSVIFSPAKISEKAFARFIIGHELGHLSLHHGVVTSADYLYHRNLFVAAIMALMISESFLPISLALNIFLIWHMFSFRLVDYDLKSELLADVFSFIHNMDIVGELKGLYPTYLNTVDKDNISRETRLEIFSKVVSVLDSDKENAKSRIANMYHWIAIGMEFARLIELLMIPFVFYVGYTCKINPKFVLAQAVLWLIIIPLILLYRHSNAFNQFHKEIDGFLDSVPVMGMIPQTTNVLTENK